MTVKKQKLLKIDPKDFEIVVEKANQFTGGNVTAWIIYASTIHEPKPEELVASN